METTLGIIEGFYGRPYSAEDRKSLIRLISSKGISYYIYAPKNDRSLRRDWQQPFTKESITFFRDLKTHCRKHNLKFGIGISPLAISEHVDKLLKVLTDKIDVLVKEADIDIISILFDDIKLYESSEGKAQNYIVRKVNKHLKENYKDKKIRLIFCPTYYTFDPILDKVFGKRPDDYFEQLVKDLDKNIEIFWTGSKVLSKSITKEDIESINRLFDRKVTIWDNYPVNDGKNICTKIYTREFTNRLNLDGTVLSHAINPMTEPLLSYAAIATLPLCYKNKTPDVISKKRLQLLDELFDGKTASIISYLNKINDDGKDALTDDEIKDFKKHLADINTKASQELLLYLDNYYSFDPACLTSQDCSLLYLFAFKYDLGVFKLIIT